MRVKVYRNLHKKCWSIMDPKTRRVIRHMDEVLLSSVSLIVGRSGRERVLREKSKNVHAYAIGEIAEAILEDCGMVEATYSPYAAEYFFEKISFAPRSSADVARLCRDGRLMLSLK